MTAYIIAIREEKLRDPAEMKLYGEKAAKARVEGMKPLAVYGTCETLEGKAADGVVLLEFPDSATAKAWYDSPAYQDARKHRLAAADYRFILFDGI